MSHMVRKLLTGAIVTAGVCMVANAAISGSQEAEPAHYNAQTSETLEQAWTNFMVYTQKINSVLERDDLSVEDMEEVHEITYTVEVALAKLLEELSSLPADLETLHLASEGDDVDAFLEAAKAYMATTNVIVAD